MLCRKKLALLPIFLALLPGMLLLASDFFVPSPAYAAQQDREAPVAVEKFGPFAPGEINPYGKYFKGQSYLNMLARGAVPIGNVIFEPACRNNWHIHHADQGGGQILLCTAGRGWYQEWGKEARELHEGDVVEIPQGVKHWHGAARDSRFAHIAVEIPGKNSHTEWLEPVSDTDYGKLP